MMLGIAPIALSIVLFVLAIAILYSILDLYGNLEGQPWEFVVLMMAGAAACATAATSAIRPGASTRILAATFSVVAVTSAAIIVAMILIM